MITRLVLLLLVVQISNPAFSQSKIIEPDYTLKFDPSNLREIKVEAILPLVNDTIYMSNVMADDLPDGWAHFVSDVSASSMNGKKINVRLVGNSTWVVDKVTTIKLRYRVSIHHDSYSWSVSGAFGRAYAEDSLLFFSGRCVFIVPRKTNDLLFHVRFDMPRGYSVSTAYDTEHEDVQQYMTKGVENLCRNGNMVGRLTKQQIKVGQLAIQFASNPNLKSGIQAISKNMNQIVSRFDKIMGGSPKGKLAVFVTMGYGISGETFNNSISLVVGGVPSDNDKSSWGYLIAHEVFHLWNGGSISPVNQQTVEWFVEGFTEYFSLMVGYQAHLFSEEQLFRLMSERLDKLMQSNRSISLAAAGKNKGANYDLIYFGGMYIALLMDIQLITSSAGKKSLEGYMNALNAQFGKTGKRYSSEDLLTVASREGGMSLRRTMESGLKRPQQLPVAEYLKKVGLELRMGNGETSIKRADHLTPEARRYQLIFLRVDKKARESNILN